MKEQFDKRLVEKIKGSFDNYEEPFDPKEWEKFSNAYFDKKKTKPIWVWTALISGIAASLVIGFLIWPSAVDFSQEEYIGYEQEEPMVEQKEPEVEQHTPTRRLPSIDNNIGEDIIKNEKDQKSMLAEGDDNGMSTPARDSNLYMSSITSKTNAKISQVLKDDLDAARSKGANSIVIGSEVELPLKKLEMAEVQEKDIKSAIEENIYTPQLSIAATKEPLKEEEAQKIINTWAMTDSPAQIDKKKGDASGVKWGLVMAPQAASNTTMGLNLGGGVMSEISLGKRLKLDVGVTFARQSIVPGQGQNVAMVMNSMPGSASADQLQQFTAPSSNRASAFMAANVLVPASPTYELNFANLDIPINLKYKVMDNPQSGLYLISGISSMIYLSQSTSETYNISYVGIAQANTLSSNQVQTLTTEISPQEGESNVDLGRMINLSFGYEYKLSNGTFLSVEPFYKLPLGNMTFVDQQFSIGGVNLRMNFQFKK